jgi:hypothetical protein
MKKLFLILKHEPLIHFLLLGLLMVVIDHYMSRDDDYTLRINRTELQQYFTAIRGEHSGRIDQQDSLDLTNQFIMRQVLFTEATQRGYDLYDPVVRDRMIEKMKATLTEDINPEDEALKNYHVENSSRYRISEGISFRLVSFEQDHQPTPDSLSILKAFLQSGVQAMDINQARYTKKSRFELMRQFGMRFAREIDAIPENTWDGPLQSSKGVHLIYVEKKHYSESLPFEAVKAQVTNDYVLERRQRSFEENYRKLLANYRIIFDPI